MRKRSLALALFGLAACGQVDSTSVPDCGDPSTICEGQPTPYQPGPVPPKPPPPEPKPVAPKTIGDPICEIRSDTCLPDDGCMQITFESACRVRPISPGKVTPACVAATATGIDGAACKTGVDCAAGFDCIQSADGGVCRRYCCVRACDEKSFCDYGELTDFVRAAPVCLPIEPCKLLAGDCATGKTCGFANDHGDTTCRAIGDAKPGESCDDRQCGADLVCLGQLGNRKCQTLCEVGGRTTCPKDEICKTTSAFKDATYGICEPI